MAKTYKHLATALPEEIYDMLEELVKRENKTKAALLREMILERWEQSKNKDSEE